jgi:hypothetical protein
VNAIYYGSTTNLLRNHYGKATLVLFQEVHKKKLRKTVVGLAIVREYLLLIAKSSKIDFLKQGFGV